MIPSLRFSNQPAHMEGLTCMAQYHFQGGIGITLPPICWQKLIRHLDIQTIMVRVKRYHAKQTRV